MLISALVLLDIVKIRVRLFTSWLSLNPTPPLICTCRWIISKFSMNVFIAFGINLPWRSTTISFTGCFYFNWVAFMNFHEFANVCYLGVRIYLYIHMYVCFYVSVCMYSISIWNVLAHTLHISKLLTHIRLRLHALYFILY